ncbi:MAG TPA: hypothetical protein VFD59_11010 [Nocardioidaceae bacterium]|nr:hypothetical protein [Nocardioidaceae bacterium]
MLEALGEKVQHVLGKAVSLTRRDLEDYRQLRPGWMARHGDRGLANWISDHLWYHVTVGLDAVDDAETREKGVTREILVSDRYRLRIKRHHFDGMVSTYPTQTALEFLEQPTGQLPGLEQVHLIAGYEWNPDERRIVRPVLSLRDTKNKIKWLVELPEDEAGTASVVELPAPGDPSGPAIVLGPGLGTEGRGEEES